jgi:hypothetical protein
MDCVSTEFIQTFSRYGLSVGTHCFVPQGYVPIVIACGADPHDDAYCYGSYVLKPIFDRKRIASMPTCVRVEVTAWLTRGIALNLKVHRNANGPALKAWLAAFDSIKFEGEEANSPSVKPVDVS